MFPKNAIFKVLGIIAAAIVVVLIFFGLIGFFMSGPSFSKNDICTVTDDNYLITDMQNFKSINLSIQAENVPDIMKLKAQNKIVVIKKGTKCKIMDIDGDHASVYILSGPYANKAGYMYNNLLKK
jgi:hypothetical protein